MASVRRFPGPAWVWPARLERWRKPTIVAVSVLGHVAVFAWMGLRTMDLPSPGQLQDTAPVIYVQIEPRPLLPDEAVRDPSVPSLAQIAETTVPPGSPAVARDLPIPTEDEDRPAAPAPRISASSSRGSASPLGLEGWTIRPETLGDRIGRGLRTRGPGCAAPGLLNDAERANCDDRFGQRAAAAAPIDDTAGSPFAAEGARRLALYEARRRPLAGGAGVVGPQDGPGSNFGIGVAGAHLDPSLQPDSTQNIRTDRRDGPR